MRTAAPASRALCGGRGRNALRAEIAFPEPVYSAHPHINRVFDTAKFRYGYQSLVTPSSVYEYDVATGESTLLKQLEVPGGFDRTLYASGAPLRHCAGRGRDTGLRWCTGRIVASRGGIRSMYMGTDRTATRCRSVSTAIG